MFNYKQGAKVRSLEIFTHKHTVYLAWICLQWGIGVSSLQSTIVAAVQSFVQHIGQLRSIALMLLQAYFYCLQKEKKTKIKTGCFSHYCTVCTIQITVVMSQTSLTGFILAVLSGEKIIIYPLLDRVIGQISSQISSLFQKSTITSVC